MSKTFKINPKYLVVLVIGMIGLSFASVPLYDLFCRVTGFGGTTQKTNKESKVVLDKKSTMLEQGEWRPTAENPSDVRGYHLSSLYSPVGWFSWEDAAKSWLKAQKDQSLLKVWFNTILCCCILIQIKEVVENTSFALLYMSILHGQLFESFVQWSFFMQEEIEDGSDASAISA